MKASGLREKLVRKAFEEGCRAAREGRMRLAPPGGGHTSGRDIRTAWLRGYDQTTEQRADVRALGSKR